jgi:hypothetical protein
MRHLSLVVKTVLCELHQFQYLALSDSNRRLWFLKWYQCWGQVHCPRIYTAAS